MQFLICFSLCGSLIGEKEGLFSILCKLGRDTALNAKYSLRFENKHSFPVISYGYLLQYLKRLNSATFLL